ncbi:hypothetical protein HDV05_001233 [Chytridiales sp. JEL 0842]|nr:hypothetical protein HDV05_001233 [Chytridiales sp. JEL 0842]
MVQPALRKDIIQDIYLSEIRGYKPVKDTAAEKVDVVDKFTIPTPPPKPELELASAQAGALEEAAVQEEAWPAVYNPIDDPHNYNSEWEFATDVDHGGVLPKRLREYDYHAEH